MRLTTMLLASALGLSLAACGSKQPSADATSDAMASDASASDPMAAAATPMPAMSAADFVAAAAASDTFEIESSKLAIAKSKDSAVTDFAKMMVKDHTKSTANLKAAAAKSSPPIKVAPKLTDEQQGDLAKLKGAAGGDFDKLYGQMQVAGHEKALAAMQGYAAGGDSAPLKAFAADTAPVVSGHLDKAKSLPQ